MAVLGRGILSTPLFIQFVHQITAVARYGDLACASSEGVSELAMCCVIHLKTVGVIVSASGMDIRRVTVKEGIRAVVKLDDFNGWTVLDLYAQKT